jgi:hypothetical protein
MKNAKRALVKAYITIIDGLGFTCYDGFAPDDAGDEYVVIINPDMSGALGKNNFNTEVSIGVDIVVKNNNFGFKRSEEIAEDILAVINANANPDLSPDFQCVTTQLANSTNLSSLLQTDNTFRTILRFEHKVSQL